MEPFSVVAADPLAGLPPFALRSLAVHVIALQKSGRGMMTRVKFTCCWCAEKAKHRICCNEEIERLFVVESMARHALCSMLAPLRNQLERLPVGVAVVRTLLTTRVSNPDRANPLFSAQGVFHLLFDSQRMFVSLMHVEVAKAKKRSAKRLREMSRRLILQPWLKCVRNKSAYSKANSLAIVELVAACDGLMSSVAVEERDARAELLQKRSELSKHVTAVTILQNAGRRYLLVAAYVRKKREVSWARNIELTVMAEAFRRCLVESSSLSGPFRLMVALQQRRRESIRRRFETLLIHRTAADRIVACLQRHVLRVAALLFIQQFARFQLSVSNVRRRRCANLLAAGDINAQFTIQSNLAPAVALSSTANSQCATSSERRAAGEVIFRFLRRLVTRRRAALHVARIKTRLSQIEAATLIQRTFLFQWKRNAHRRYKKQRPMLSHNEAARKLLYFFKIAVAKRRVEAQRQAFLQQLLQKQREHAARVIQYLWRRALELHRRRRAEADPNAHELAACKPSPVAPRFDPLTAAVRPESPKISPQAHEQSNAPPCTVSEAAAVLDIVSGADFLAQRTETHQSLPFAAPLRGPHISEQSVAVVRGTLRATPQDVPKICEAPLPPIAPPPPRATLVAGKLTRSSLDALNIRHDTTQTALQHDADNLHVYFEQLPGVTTAASAIGSLLDESLPLSILPLPTPADDEVPPEHRAQFEMLFAPSAPLLFPANDEGPLKVRPQEMRHELVAAPTDEMDWDTIVQSPHPMGQVSLQSGLASEPMQERHHAPFVDPFAIQSGQLAVPTAQPTISQGQKEPYYDKSLHHPSATTVQQLRGADRFTVTVPQVSTLRDDVVLVGPRIRAQAAVPSQDQGTKFEVLRRVGPSALQWQQRAPHALEQDLDVSLSTQSASTEISLASLDETQGHGQNPQVHTSPPLARRVPPSPSVFHKRETNTDFSIVNAYKAVWDVPYSRFACGDDIPELDCSVSSTTPSLPEPPFAAVAATVVEPVVELEAPLGEVHFARNSLRRTIEHGGVGDALLGPGESYYAPSLLRSAVSQARSSPPSFPDIMIEPPSSPRPTPRRRIRPLGGKSGISPSEAMAAAPSSHLSPLRRVDEMRASTEAMRQSLYKQLFTESPPHPSYDQY